MYIIQLLEEVEAAVEEEEAEEVVYRVAGQLVEVTEVGVDTEEVDEGVDTGAEAEEEEVAADCEYDLCYYSTASLCNQLINAEKFKINECLFFERKHGSSFSSEISFIIISWG